ncbi:lysosomal amino acid transporter 1 homolog [Latimeria chalumnae]|uniref:Solute carrier family 66 member 1 n=1 Tax=Latimeria chalumnae TaxID=7897 RepID=H3A4A5_LATCH|nr:PREDICTED: putative uncharacterized protein PQLC2L [Latimeria chalumnae]|eukprot:XP_006002213.1 PREDICTED: putative uncharacterized protein PQLC2L [Latimeria chalumnae]
MGALLYPIKHQHTLNFSHSKREMCVNGTPWIWHLFEECAENMWEHWSVVIGVVSIFCFLFAALPQLYVAHKNGKVDQALSIGFLLCWLGGDLTNVVGCYLTNQMPIQLVTAIFYVGMDTIMISQFAYYTLKNQKKKSSILKWFCLIWIVVCLTLSVILPSRILKTPGQNTESLTNKNTLDLLEMSGYICGYVSCMFYLASRFPQLYKNFQRKSTEGTSYLLFVLAMMGNGTYGLSLVIKVPGINEPRNTYILHHLAWLIGSFGVLLLDIFMTAQFIVYRKHRKKGPSLVALQKVAEVEPLLDEDPEEET